MELFGYPIQFSNVVVAFGPELDHGRHEFDMAKPAKQRDHAGNIIGVIAPFDEPLPCGGKIRNRFFQFEAGFLIAHRNSDRLAIIVVIGLATSLGIAQKGEHRPLLPLGPQAFSFRIGAGGHQDAHAFGGQQKQNDNDDQEWPDNEQQARATGQNLQDSVPRFPVLHSTRCYFVINHKPPGKKGFNNTPESRAANLRRFPDPDPGRVQILFIVPVFIPQPKVKRVIMGDPLTEWREIERGDGDISGYEIPGIALLKRMPGPIRP